MLVAESRMVMGKAHVFHVGSLSDIINIGHAEHLPFLLYLLVVL